MRRRGDDDGLPMDGCHAAAAAAAATSAAMAGPPMLPCRPQDEGCTGSAYVMQQDHRIADGKTFGVRMTLAWSGPAESPPWERTSFSAGVAPP